MTVALVTELELFVLETSLERLASSAGVVAVVLSDDMVMASNGREKALNERKD